MERRGRQRKNDRSYGWTSRVPVVGIRHGWDERDHPDFPTRGRQSLSLTSYGTEGFLCPWRGRRLGKRTGISWRHGSCREGKEVKDRSTCAVK